MVTRVHIGVRSPVSVVACAVTVNLLLQIVGRTTGGCLSPRFWTYYHGYRIAKGRVRFPRSGSFHEVAPSGESSNGVPLAWKAVGGGRGWHYCGSRSTCDALSRRFRGPCSVVGIVSRRNHPGIGRIRGGASAFSKPGASVGRSWFRTGAEGHSVPVVGGGKVRAPDALRPGRGYLLTCGCTPLGLSIDWTTGLPSYPIG